MADKLQHDDSISVPEAIRLKHSLNQSITWGNSSLNALEVEKLTTLTAENYAQVRMDYREWNASMATTMTLVLFTLGSVALYIFISYWWLKGIAIGVGISCFYQLCRREGHSQGYIDGYDAGHEAGIHKALGIKPEELKEMHEFATDMKIDNGLVKRMDERQTK